MLGTVINAIIAAVDVPVTPAPLRKASKAVVFHYYTGKNDGSLVSGRLELRFTATDFEEALALMNTVRRALISSDGESKVGEGAGKIMITETDAGGVSGYSHGCGLFYVKTSYKLEGRGDIYG